MDKLLGAARRLNWLLAVLLAVVAAVIFSKGYEEIAAIVWLASLILVLPVLGQRR
jgi:hypothetical protein